MRSDDETRRAEAEVRRLRRELDDAGRTMASLIPRAGTPDGDHDILRGEVAAAQEDAKWWEERYREEAERAERAASALAQAEAERDAARALVGEVVQRGPETLNAHEEGCCCFCGVEQRGSEYDEETETWVDTPIPHRDDCLFVRLRATLTASPSGAARP